MTGQTVTAEGLTPTTNLPEGTVVMRFARIAPIPKGTVLFTKIVRWAVRAVEAVVRFLSPRTSTSSSGRPAGRPRRASASSGGGDDGPELPPALAPARPRDELALGLVPRPVLTDAVREAIPRFVSKLMAVRVSTKVETPCLLIDGKPNSDGYVQFRVDRHTREFAHRFSYVAFVGPCAGLEIDHVCEVKICVRPSHLRAVTALEHRRKHRKTKGSQVSRLDRLTQAITEEVRPDGRTYRVRSLRSE